MKILRKTSAVILQKGSDECFSEPKRASRRRTRGVLLCGGIFAKGEYIHPCALKVSFQIFGWDMRTRFCALHKKRALVLTTNIQKADNRKGCLLFVWSKWRVSELETVDNCLRRRARAKQGDEGERNERRATTMLASRRRTLVRVPRNKNKVTHER